jgi:hypothetical protein
MVSLLQSVLEAKGWVFQMERMGWIFPDSRKENLGLKIS